MAMLVSATASFALPRDEMNPGRLGFNALSPFEASSPWVDERWRLTMGAGVQWVTPGDGIDFSYTMPFRLEYPFVKRAVLWVEGSPFEGYQYSTPTQRFWAPTRDAGVTPADISFGSRFLVFPGRGWIPAIGVRVLVKTATGENLGNRRFLDAPAYQMDLLLGHRLGRAGGRFGQLELVVCLGFLSWQQGSVGQNDAFAAAGRIRWDLERAAAQLEVRGYVGWQANDRPVEANLGLEWKVAEPLQLLVSVTERVRDPVGVEVRLGVRVSGPTARRP
jgi:hypothetical protein